MKKTLFILAFVLTLIFAFSVVSFATEADNTYYVVQNENSDIAQALREEGKNVLGVSKLYSSRNDSLKSDSTYFLNQFDNKEINLILAESVSYSISSTNSPLGAGIRLDKAITMNVYFNGYSWWIPDDSTYAGFFVANEKATLSLIGNRTEEEVESASSLATEVSASKKADGVDFYAGFIGLYVQMGNLTIKDAVIMGHDEVIYQKDYWDGGEARGTSIIHLENCAVYNSTKWKPITLIAENKNSTHVKIEMDHCYTSDTSLYDVVSGSYIKNSKMKSIYTDSWHADDLIGKDYIYITDSVIDSYTAIGDTQHPIAVNSTFGKIDLQGDSTGGGFMTLINSTYTSINLIRKSNANTKRNGALYIVTPADCVTAAVRVVYTYDDSLKQVVSSIDDEYPIDNPALGHDTKGEIISISYGDYTKYGDITYVCSVCSAVHTVEDTAEPLILAQGYSAPEDERGGIAAGFEVNLEAIAKYETVTGKKVNYGGFAVAQAKIGTNDIFDKDGNKAKGVISADVTEYGFKTFELKIIGFNEEQKDATLALGAYIKVTDGDKVEYSYIQKGKAQENEKYYFVSYNSIANPPLEVIYVDDITLEEGTSAILASSVTIDGKEIALTYTFDGTDISIENYVLKSLNKNTETTVTISGDGVTGEFKVIVTESTKYKYVVVIGVDGAGAYFQNAITPNIDTIFANGAITYNCLTSNPTISAQCWGSLLHGVTPSVHGLTNSIVSSSAYPNDSKYPSVFRVIKENDANAVLASFCNWNPINVGIIENNIGVHKVGGLSDSNLTNKIVSYVGENNPTLLFVQFDEADGAGHSYGYGTDTQLAKITEIDGYIGQIYEAYKQKGILDDTLFIVTSDHGGSGTSHGGLTDTEKYVMFAAAGKNVEKGTIEDMEIRDTASIVLHALGYESPETWTSRVPSGLFHGVTAGERPVYIDKESDRYHETEPTPEKNSEGYITNYISSEDHALTTYLTLDKTAEDTQGKTTTENGTLYYIEDGYFDQAVRLDEGYISIKDFAQGTNSFTISFWINTQGVTGGDDPCIISNKNWDSGKNKGLAIAITQSYIRLNFGDGSNRSDCDYYLKSDYKEGWMHVIAIVDRDAQKLTLCIDFTTIVTADINQGLYEDSIDTSYGCLNIGQDGTGKYADSLPAAMDEIMIFQGAFDQEDINSLAEYYGIEK